MERFAPAVVGLRIGTYDLFYGGRDRDGRYVRWSEQIAMLRRLPLDVLCLQAATHWDRNRGARVKATATELGMTAKLARVKNGSHLVTLVREPKVQITHFYPDIVEGRFLHTASRADLQVEGVDWPLRLLHTHFSPVGPEDRAREAGWLTEYGGRPDTLLIGNLNSSAPDDPQPPWDWIPRHLHSRYRIQNPDGSYGDADRRAMHALLHAGFQDPAALLDVGRQGTVGYEYPPDVFEQRSDYVLPTSRLLNTRAELVSYGVVDNETTRSLSTHLPVVAEFALRRSPQVVVSASQPWELGQRR